MCSLDERYGKGGSVENDGEEELDIYTTLRLSDASVSIDPQDVIKESSPAITCPTWKALLGVPSPRRGRPPANALGRDQRNKRKIPPHSVGHILLPPKSSQWPRFIVAALGTFSTFTQCPYTRHGKDHSGSACDNVRARPLKLTPSFAFK